MAKRNNHYEAAFEAWLAWLRLPYLAIDESKRHTFGGRTLKSLDFLVSGKSPGAEGWLVDVKGRRFPTAGQQYWRNWSTRDELTSLANWEELLGPPFAGMLVFAYQVVGDRAPLPPDELFVFDGRLYGFVGIRLDHYTSWARPLSARWDTVAVPTPRFRDLARPARELLLPAATAEWEAGAA
jgi:hypothetical protein